ncbi:MAG: hypothetical protein ACTS27_12195, partial [Phycisphaerales bacterium]
MPSAAPLLRKFGLSKVFDLELHADAPDEPVAIDPAVAALVDEIRAYNPSAGHAFLASFEKPELETYLAHLASSREPRGPRSRWERPGDTPAMV